MASIYKRGKCWHVQYRENGKLVQRSLRTNSQRLARQKLAEIEVNLAREQLGMGKRLKSNEAAFEGFEDEILAKKSPPWKLRTYQLMRSFKQWALAQDALVTALSTSDIERFFKQRCTEISDKTANEELAMIKRFFRWLQNRDYLVKDPAASIERLKQSPSVVRIFTPQEIQLIMKHATPTQRPFYQMLLFTGLRDGEMRNLEWDDVDFEQNVLYVRIKQDWKPKTGRGRIVPLAYQAREVLMTLTRQGPYVFSTRNGNRWAPPRQPWMDLLDRIDASEGVKLKHQVSLHTFRHTFATLCLMQGVDIKTVSEFLGHSSVKMTEKYLHILPSHKIAQMKRVSFGALLVG